MSHSKKIIVILAILFALMTAGGSALATDLIIDDLNLSGENCNTFCIPITVQGFSNVAGVELHLFYDESCMTFDSVSVINLSGATTNVGAGAVHIIWEDYLNPLTLTDGDQLTQICFSNISAAPDAPCTFGFQATCELADEFGDPFPLTLTDGSVACAGGCCVMRGDINHDGAPTIDISDLVYLINYMFSSGPAPICFDEADCNSSGTEPLDISDLLYLINYMFQEGPLPGPCP